MLGDILNKSLIAFLPSFNQMDQPPKSHSARNLLANTIQSSRLAIPRASSSEDARYQGRNGFSSCEPNNARIDSIVAAPTPRIAIPPTPLRIVIPPNSNSPEEVQKQQGTVKQHLSNLKEESHTRVSRRTLLSPPSTGQETGHCNEATEGQWCETTPERSSGDVARLVRRTCFTSC